MSKPRARELGLDFPGETGTWNAITDVPGVRVGLTTLISGDGPLAQVTTIWNTVQGPARVFVTREWRSCGLQPRCW